MKTYTIIDYLAPSHSSMRITKQSLTSEGLQALEQYNKDSRRIYGQARYGIEEVTQ